MKKEFISVFQLSKTIIFEVNYYTLGNNANPYFSTCACQFNRPKSDYNMCGQCQDELTKHSLTARNFWKKWDIKHCEDLTEAEYAEMRHDLEKLESMYNFMILESEGKIERSSFPFSQIREFSKQTPKTQIKIKKGV